jgi:hypothetical protein
MKKFPTANQPLPESFQFQLVNKEVVASATGTCERTVENWMRQKRIPFVRISARCVRFNLAEVLAALSRFTVKPAR